MWIVKSRIHENHFMEMSSILIKNVCRTINRELSSTKRRNVESVWKLSSSTAEAACSDSIDKKPLRRFPLGIPSIPKDHYQGSLTRVLVRSLP